MFDELMKSTPGAPAAPGVDPLSQILVPETSVAAPVPPPTSQPVIAPSVQDAVPGSA